MFWNWCSCIPKVYCRSLAAAIYTNSIPWNTSVMVNTRVLSGNLLLPICAHVQPALHTEWGAISLSLAFPLLNCVGLFYFSPGSLSTRSS